jgi:hypothetical protein
MAQTSVNQAQSAVVDHEVKLEEQEKVRMEIHAEFDKLMLPGVPRAALLKVFQKRITIKSENLTKETNSDSESDSDSGSDFDDNSYVSDEDDGNVCPTGCDLAIYERVCDLRTLKAEATDRFNDIQRSLDGKRKALESAKKKLRSATDNMNEAHKLTAAFEKVKQQSLNGIQTAFILPISCINIGEAYDSEMIVFSKSKLLELENQISLWDAETLKLKRQHQDLKREYSSLLAQRNEKTVELQNLQQKYTENQLRKFGKLINLEDLDKVVNCAESTEELKEKLRVQEIEYNQEINEIRKAIMHEEREVIRLTEVHTKSLQDLMTTPGFLSHTTTIVSK